MSILKQFVLRDIKTGIDTEIQGQSFKEVYNKYKGKNIQLILQRYDSGILGIGWDFKSECLIGNLKDKLTIEDYYKALDVII